MKTTCVAALTLILAATARGQLPEPAPRTAPPDRWAILIGVDSHEDPAVPGNRRAVFDALAVNRWLTGVAGWPATNVMILSDGGGLRHGDKNDPGRRFVPSKRNLDWAVREWLASRVKPGDFVLIYFAGHAVSLPPRKDDPPGTRPRDYLVPSDVRASDYDLTAWSLDAALDALPSRGTNPILCWLDTSAVGRGRGVPLPADARSNPGRLLATLSRWPGTSAWMAGAKSPIAESPRADLPSPFVAAMIEGQGTPAAPSTLLACLDLARRNPALVRQGFAAVGGVAPDLSLWTGDAARRLRPNGDLVVQAGHADRVGAVVVSADGVWAATASMDSTVRIWSIRRQALLRTVSGFSEGVRSLALSPDNRRIVAGDGYGNVRFWERESAEPSSRSGPPPHAGPVEFVGFLPDSTTALSWDAVEGKVLLWNTAAPDGAPRAVGSGRATAVACGSRRAAVVAAIADEAGKVSLISASGGVARVLERPDAPVAALALSPDGREAAVVGESDLIERFDVASGRRVGEPIRAVGRPGWLSYGADGALYHRAGRSLGRDAATAKDVLPGETGRIALSADAAWIALADDAVGGSTQLFSVDPNRPGVFAGTPLARPAADRRESTAAVFSPDGLALLVGEASGAIRSWSLPDGEIAFQVKPNRRRAAWLAASPDGRTLLQISAPDGRANLFDMDAATIRTIPGEWSEGRFLDANTLVMAEAGETGGEIRAVDALRGSIIPRSYARPRSEDGGRESNAAFDKVVVAPDGAWIAAGSKAGQSPVVAFWRPRTGELLGVVREEGLDLRGIAVSPDSARVALAVDSKAVVFDVNAAPWSAKRGPVFDFEEAEPANAAGAVTAAGWLKDGRLALGTAGGRVQIWNPGDNAVERLAGGALAGPARAILATADGKWLAAAGEDRSLRVWPLGTPRPQPVVFNVSSGHSERVNTLTEIGSAGVIVSGADDAKARFWSPKGAALLGTLGLVDPRPIPARAKARPVAALDVPEWVCVTPGGLFDASNDGADHARWTIGEDVRSLEQIADKGYYVHRLTSFIVKGEVPPKPAPPADDPPALTLELGKLRAPADQEAELVLTVGEPGLPDVRLYQNGFPIGERADFRPTDDPRRWTTSVRLRNGENRFWAMAGRPGRVDGRSTTLAAAYTGPDLPPRLHIVAIGISEYQRRALRYADDDAKAIAEFFHNRGVELGGEPGLKALLTDREVDQANIDRSFRAIRDEVRRRPQDTVVVFIAGHTDVLDKKFCLLLPDYPFEADEPLIVASRGGDGRAAKNPKAVLPYAAIYTQIARLSALQRLVVVDACQAEAIKSDPQVELIRRYMATDSRKAKTSYLFAAREGEAATEVSDLKHGLLTYSVLRGFRSGEPGPAVDPLAGAGVPPDADLDGDGTVETRELELYVKAAIPVLASKYNSLVKRGDPARPSDETAPVKLQADDASFPILPAPRTVSAERPGPPPNR